MDKKIIRAIAEFCTMYGVEPNAIILGTHIMSQLRKESRHLVRKVNDNSNVCYFYGYKIIEPFSCEMADIIAPILMLER